MKILRNSGVATLLPNPSKICEIVVFPGGQLS